MNKDDETNKSREFRYLIRDILLGAAILLVVVGLIVFTWQTIFVPDGRTWQESWLYGKWADLLLWFQYIVL